MEFVEIPTFWCPRVGHVACTNFSTRTVELRPSERQELLPFLSLLSFPFPFSFLPSFSFPLSFYELLSSTKCFFVSFFSFLFDSLFFSYFSSHFSFSISPPIWSTIDRMGQRRQFSPHVWPSIFLLFFLISYFFFDITLPCGSL